VENRVHFALWWQLQTVSNNTHVFQYLKRTKKFEGQLAVRAPSNRRLNIRLQAQEYTVAHSKLALPTMLVSLEFHALLHPKQVLLDRIQNQAAGIQPFLNINRSNLVSSCNTKVSRRPAIQ
jgi:hypothetical protein